MQQTIQIPNKILPLFHNKLRYAVLYGGRGSGKSWGVALFLILKAIEQKTRVLCTREIQTSIKDSVYKLLSDTISAHGLDGLYNVKHDSIHSFNGSEFIFKGLLRNSQEIKSTEGIDIAWCEEAASTSRKSLDILIPTIRKPGSQIIFTMNPTNDDDPVYTDFILKDRDDVLKIKANYNDNPFFPAVLKSELEYDKRVDYDKYLHVWEGQCVRHSAAQVFYGKWVVDDFAIPEGVMYYQGLDFGFSVDPTAFIRCYIQDNKLFITDEIYHVNLDIDKTPEKLKAVPDVEKWALTADSSRPETINYLRRYGFPKIKSSIKGAGSVEDGIAFLRSFEKIIVHPRCKNTINELRTYSYKINKITGEITPILEDKANHLIDALRYALEDLMRFRKTATNKIAGW